MIWKSYNVGWLFKACDKTGQYIDISHIPGAMIVNIGDLMQQWTADKITSTVSPFNKLIPQGLRVAHMQWSENMHTFRHKANFTWNYDWNKN